MLDIIKSNTPWILQTWQKDGLNIQCSVKGKVFKGSKKQNVLVFTKLYVPLTLFRMGFFGAVGGGEEVPPHRPKIYQTCPAMIKFYIVIPYLNKIQNVYNLHDLPLEF